MSQQNKAFENDSIDDLFRGISQTSSALSKNRSPFKFLDPYGLEDRELFFGRDLEISELYRKFYISPLLLVYGESGSGKTSLIQCGLQTEIPREDALFITARMAIGKPQAVLEKAINKQLKSPISSTKLDDMLDALYQQKSKPIVLVLDQFEEFFLFHSKHVRKAFSKQIAQWLQEKSYLRIIISIREEYYARLTELEAELPQLFNNRLWVRNMSRVQAQDVITQPCKICNIDIEDTLSDKLLDDLTQDNKEIDLPILQVILDTLYHQAKSNNVGWVSDSDSVTQQTTENEPTSHNAGFPQASTQPTLSDNEPITLSLAAYKTLGKINKILANFIEERLAKHKNAERSRQILKAMISAQGTRKISKLKDIQQRTKSFGAAIPLQQLQHQLQQLSQDRILSEDAANGFYELRHDSLAQPIHDWMTGLEKEMVALRQDIDNRYQEYCKRNSLLDADFLKLLIPFEKRLHLEEAQQRFVQKSRQQQRRKLRNRIIILLTLFLGVLATVSSLWFQAEQAKEKALAERERAIELINYMNFDLRDKLEFIGQLDIMDGVQQRINQFFDSIELTANDKTALRQKATGLLQYAKTLSDQGKAEQAEALYLQAHQLF